MSANPQTLEEVSKSLQRIIDHPRTHRALKREARYLAEFRGSRPDGYISKRLAKNYNDSWMLKIIGKVWINMFFIAPMSDGQHAITIFVETEIEGAKARFGLWCIADKTISEIETSQISHELEKMQYILHILVRQSLGDYRTAEVPEYI